MIEAAESMFADSGLEGVSTRQIGAAIGSSNNNVVAYHFGSREALIEAIYYHRLPQIDARREELLRSADNAGQSSDAAGLMRALWLPLFEQTDGQGRHSYARFLASLIRGSASAAASRYEISADFPATNRVVDRLRNLLPDGAQSRFNLRLQLASGIIFNALQLIDRDGQGDDEAAEADFADALQMAAAAFCADS